MARRWSVVIGGLLLLGAAAGVAAALMRRHVEAEEWEEYPSPEQVRRETSMFEVAKSAISEVAKAGAHVGGERHSSGSESAAERTSDLIGSRPPARSSEPA